MFTLHLTVERTAGAIETVLHGAYRTRREAERSGETLRLLYDWVKSFEVRAAAAPPAPAEKPPRKMTRGPHHARRRRKSS